ncbi:cytochrome d ubiquinol oxidase subunit II [Effusibacillus lacus]|uniref:Cytochrome D ubiquinol oxidase subunit II n=1 Tax=Effusibacillus lacus TaxID=1348429 RepID=A0A292YPN6_9BACL|nr:cytochrome d ubiquinol oxidase subunit II [Effusibacillus lacus]TCS76522.1 cytochrome bd-I ubiquinol oxidase subunit 2 apoprotein [Effusibacillus lacus]GAX90455.1 cytochrome D ubiquinol oxidase subunit II [Effusibacillus lacus]
MSYELIGITVLWLFLYGYVIVASIDFGAGFFSYYGKVTGKGEVINQVINRYLSPVWEVTNVFLIFFLVGIVGFFPDTAYYFGTALLVPGSIALILLAIRGSFYAFHHYGSKPNTFYEFLYGTTGLLIPASLATILTISEGGFIEKKGNEVVLLMDTLLKSPYSWSVVLLALVSVLFISASFLTYYAHKAEDYEAERVLHKWALGWSLPTIFASFLVFVAMSDHNMQHFTSMLDNSWMFVVSMGFFTLAVYLLMVRKYYGWMFLSVLLQFGFAFFGYGKSHLPYILYPYITVQGSVNNPVMAQALIWAFIGGLSLLVPSLLLLMKLFLFDAKYVKGR